MKTGQATLIALVSVLGAGACDPGDGDLYKNDLEDVIDDEGRINFRTGHDNGEELNGINLNGMRLNGMRLNGEFLNGMRLNGMRLNGEALTGLQMIGNILQAIGEDLSTRSGADLEGAVVSTEVTHPDTSVVETEWAYTNFEDGPNGLVLMNVQYRELPDTTWQPACKDGADQPVKAVQLLGSWDPESGDPVGDQDVVSYGCLKAALGDCALWGYVPGKVVSGKDLRAYHQACTRAKRADYCGKGETHTQNGTSIDIYDDLGVQEEATNWGIEALYNEFGAVCINTPRKTNWTHTGVITECASKGKSIDTCVDVDHDGDIDFDDYPTARIAIRNIPTAPY
ncbi:MAG: ADYC domain-containing protein [Nannocystaceae bacterium]